MVLVVIPARGGSKRLSHKNIKPLQGRPLISYTIDSTRELFKDHQIIVSTDDEDIVKTVEKTGLKVPFMRPEKLASDKAGPRGVVLHAINFMEKKGYTPEIVVLLQPTSPFRTSRHIKEALQMFYDSNAEMVTSVVETKSNPYFVLKEENEEGFLEPVKKGNFKRSQDCPKVWELNGAIYIFRVSSIKSEDLSKFKMVKKYVMDEMSSLDIDDEVDWLMAEKFAKKLF
jgi:CMP-N,N'-diacetyllegionaminic acid synthase